MNRQIGKTGNSHGLGPLYEGETSVRPLASEATAPPFVTFGEMFGALLRRKWLLLGLVTGCTAIGLAIAYSQPAVYQAKALI